MFCLDYALMFATHYQLTRLLAPPGTTQWPDQLPYSIGDIAMIVTIAHLLRERVQVLAQPVV